MTAKAVIPRPYISRAEAITRARQQLEKAEMERLQVALLDSDADELALSAGQHRKTEVTPPALTEVMTPDLVERLRKYEDIITSDGAFPLQEFTHEGHRYISLTKLASDVGISLSHLSRILTHQRRPSLVVAIRLASAMGITLDALVERLGLLPATAQ